jgi:hypothetical protein
MWRFVHDMQTVRSWTGLWILFYGALGYYETGGRRNLLIMFIPPLVHVAYFVMAIPVWVVAFLKEKKLVYIALYFLSFFTLIIPQSFLLTQLNKTQAGASKVQSYYVEEKTTFEEQQKAVGGKNFYDAYYSLGFQFWGIQGVAITLILFGAYFNYMNKLESSLFSAGLLMKVLSNSTWFLFALSNRTDYASGLFILATVVLLFSRRYFHFKGANFKWQKFLLGCAFLFFIPYWLYKLTEAIRYGSFFLFMFPFVPWVDSSWNEPIKAMIKYLL